MLSILILSFLILFCIYDTRQLQIPVQVILYVIKSDVCYIKARVITSGSYQVVLTKADLLSAAQLAHAMAMTRADMGAILSDLESEARRILSSASAPRGGDAAESPPRPVWRQGVVLPPEALVVPVSAATGAGIQPLWLSVCDAARRCALTTSPSGAPLPPNAVREHAAANAMRRQKQLELVQ